MRSENVIGRIMRVISIAISVMLVVIVLVICAQTFFRYVVFKSLSWSEEVSRFLFAILVSWVLLCKQAAKIFQTICKKETALKRVLRNLLSAISFAQI